MGFVVATPLFPLKHETLLFAKVVVEILLTVTGIVVTDETQPFFDTDRDTL